MGFVHMRDFVSVAKAWCESEDIEYKPGHTHERAPLFKNDTTEELLMTA